MVLINLRTDFLAEFTMSLLLLTLFLLIVGATSGPPQTVRLKSTSDFYLVRVNSHGTFGRVPLLQELQRERQNALD